MKYFFCYLILKYKPNKNIFITDFNLILFSILSSFSNSNILVSSILTLKIIKFTKDKTIIEKIGHIKKYTAFNSKF